MKWSEELALEFPYDWMSDSMSEEALIAAVLQRGRFNDMSTVCVHFGLARVEQVAIDFKIDLAHPVRAPLMRSIRLATANFENHANT